MVQGGELLSLGRGERTLIQNEVQVHTVALQNGLVSTTPTERRKTLKKVISQIRWNIKGEHQRTQRQETLSEENKTWLKGLSLLPALLPAHLILLPLFMGNKRELKMLAWDL